MNKIIWVKIKSCNYYKLLVKLNNIGISIYDNKIINNYILVKIRYKDYKRIKKYLISYDISIYGNTGIYKIKEIINKYIVFVIGSIIGIGFLFLANNTIFKVVIKSNNDNICKLLENELNRYGLGKMKLKKKHREVEKIVNNILDNNKDILEYIEVKYKGLIMEVEVTEKIDTNEEKTYNNCNIIAKTDAKISSLNVYRGVSLKEINDYVLKGEVILSGSIIHNEELKNEVCASGEVYGEVWYKVIIEVPFIENYIEYTGKNRYNLNIKINDNDYQIFKSRIKNKKEIKSNIYKLNDFEINLVKEKEYVINSKKLSENEAYNKGISMGIEKIKLTLLDNEEILLKKVLKKEVNDSTIYLEMFVVTKENIGQLQVIE